MRAQDSSLYVAEVAEEAETPMQAGIGARSRLLQSLVDAAHESLVAAARQL